MDPELRARALAHGGVISAYLMHEMGFDDRAIARLVRDGSLVRVRYGCFVLGDLLARAEPTEAYRLRVAAVLLGRAAPRKRREPRALIRASHHAGLAVHGLPLHDCDLRLIDLSAQVAHGSRQGIVRVHPLAPGDVAAKVKGVVAASVATCVIQTAASSGVVAGVVALDAALNQELVTLDVVRARAEAMDVHYGARWVSLALDQADPLSESPGESRTRLILRSLGMTYVAQAEIKAPGFVARVDFLIGKVVVEFDGAIKYAGASGHDALVREKRREDELRRLGYEIVRLTWADLNEPGRVGRLIREAQVRASVR